MPDKSVVLETMTVDEAQTKYADRTRITRPASPQRLAIRSLNIGEAILLSHEGLTCPNNNALGCALTRAVANEAKLHRQKRFISRHIDGNVLVTLQSRNA